MLTTFRRLSNMAAALVNAAAKEIKDKEVDPSRASVAPELCWVTRRLALTEGSIGMVVEKSGAWYK